jgi:hypothetical protein
MRLAMRSIVDSPQLFFAVLFLVLLAATEIGCRLASTTRVNQDPDLREPVVSLRDSLLVLLSLLLGFTFAMAVGRFEHRRELVVDEANAIATTRLRAQLFADPSKTRVDQLLQQYAAERVKFGEAGLRAGGLAAVDRQSVELQTRLWNETEAIAAQEKSPIVGLFIQSVNEMIDLDAKRLAALENRIPPLIWILIAFVAALTCLCYGFSAKKRFWFPMVVLPLMVAAVAALISDLDTPRSGFIHIDQASMQRLQQGSEN